MAIFTLPPRSHFFNFFNFSTTTTFASVYISNAKKTSKQKDQEKFQKLQEKINGMAVNNPNRAIQESLLDCLKQKAQIKTSNMPSWIAMQSNEERKIKEANQYLSKKLIRHNKDMLVCDSGTDEENDESVPPGVTVPSDDCDDNPSKYLCHCGCGRHYEKMTYCNIELNQTGQGEKSGCRTHISKACRLLNRQCSDCAKLNNEASHVLTRCRSRSRSPRHDDSSSYLSGRSERSVNEGHRTHQEYRERVVERDQVARCRSRSRSRNRNSRHDDSSSYLSGRSEHEGHRTHQEYRGRVVERDQVARCRSRSRNRNSRHEGSSSYWSGGTKRSQQNCLENERYRREY